MHTAEDYYLFFAAIDWYSDWQENRRWLEENRRKCQMSRRQCKSYVQEWDEVLESLQGKKSA